jgi:hypothetical protein
MFLNIALHFVGVASVYRIAGIVAQKLIIYICTGRQVVEEDEPHLLYDEEDSVLKEISESISKNRRNIIHGSNVNPGNMHAQPIVSVYS